METTIKKLQNSGLLFWQGAWAPIVRNPAGMIRAACDYRWVGFTNHARKDLNRKNWQMSPAYPRLRHARLAGAALVEKSICGGGRPSGSPLHGVRSSSRKLCTGYDESEDVGLIDVESES
jgi:hypothetical protein